MSEQNKSDYHVLGGWLKFIVVMAYLSAGLLGTSGITAIVALINAVRVVSAYSSYASASAGLLWGTAIFLIALIGVFVWYELKFAKMIKERNPCFLQFYHRVALVMLAISLVGQVFLPDAGSTSQSVLSTLIGVVVWTIYFVKSERVHVYMGSDEYLWQSRITRRYASQSYDGTNANSYSPTPRQSAGSQEKSAADNNQRPVSPVSTPKISNPAPLYVPIASPYPLNNCCICGGSLNDGHAVLFTDPNGNEARVDEGCYKAIYTLAKSNDRQEVNNAGYFLQSQLPSINPAVAAYLQDYLNAGIQFLSQPEGTVR